MQGVPSAIEFFYTRVGKGKVSMQPRSRRGVIGNGFGFAERTSEAAGVCVSLGGANCAM